MTNWPVAVPHHVPASGPVRPARRWIGFAPGLFYSVGSTLLGIGGALLVIGMGPGESEVGRSLFTAALWGIFLLVIAPAVFAWGGLIGSALGARWAFVLLMAPAFGHTVLAGCYLLMKGSLVLVLLPIMLGTAAAGATAPWMRPPPRGAAR